MDIYDYNCYRKYLNQWIKSFPTGGRGLNRKMAEVLNCNSSFVSQFLSGSKDLNLEQAMKLSKFLNHTSLEQKYFINLVSFDRAGEFQLQEYFKKELKNLQNEGKKLKNQLQVNKSLNLADSIKYYSDPTYSLVRLAFSIDSINTKKDLQSRLNIKEEKLDRILTFLLDTSLLKKQDENFVLTDLKTHINSESGIIKLHHKNWRLKALERQEHKEDFDLFYTGPMTVAYQDADKVKKILEEALKKIYGVIEVTNPNEVYCLNMDWFRVLDREELE